MRFVYKYMICLLSVCMALLSSYAQEISDTLQTVQSDTLKKSACIPVKTVSENQLAYNAGEKLHFTLSYELGALRTDLADASVSLESRTLNGQDVFHVAVEAKTIRIYDFFFKVREDFQSWFTRDGLRPLKFTRDTHEGRYHATNDYVYNWEAAEPYIAADVYSSSRGKGRRQLQLPLDPCTFDLPALFFYARNMDFDVVEPGKKYPMTFAIDDEVYHVYFILHGRETVDVKGLGKVKTIKFAAKLVAGEIFSGETDMMIWVSDDENRVPVCFEAPIRVGAGAGRLQDWSGLKHPFTALIEPAAVRKK